MQYSEILKIASKEKNIELLSGKKSLSWIIKKGFYLTPKYHELAK
jgi:hypothetical protein